VSEFLLGGQAVMEGVMMRGPTVMAVAVRMQNGEIAVERLAIPQLSPRFSFMKWPVLRGIRSLWQALVLGFKAIGRSTELADTSSSEESALGKSSIAGAMIVAVCLSIGLFFLLPLALTQTLGHVIQSVNDSPLLFNLIESALRLAVFLLYLVAIRLLPDVKRFFQYHGAEHKVIYAFEAGEPLDVEHAKSKSPYHPRCGTNFLMTVMIIAMLVISITPHDVSVIAKAGWRVLLIPVIAGLSFELIRLSVKSKRAFLQRLVVGPGMFLQRLTAIEPNEEQIKVALEALNAVDLVIAVPSPAEKVLVQAAAS